uniref:Peptidase S1 domain-containing protein n=1 Tax=Meloidogyne hapla TaxID=6305 RepID=A0A1I8C1E3_MELHA
MHEKYTFEQRQNVTLELELFTKLPRKFYGDEVVGEDSDSEGSYGCLTVVPKDRRTPFLNKTIDLALKNTYGCPKLLNSVYAITNRAAGLLKHRVYYKSLCF